MGVLAFLHHAWLVWFNRGGYDFALLHSGTITRIEKGPSYWGGDEWQTAHGTIHSREIKEVGTREQAGNLT
jgi:hypothetical protein